MQNVAALERSDNVAERGHAFAGLKRGYTRRNQSVGRTVPSPPSSSTRGTRRVRDNAPYL